jgi:EAL domain-containing protein (putative c-di-GMP-specific phosphodiesterase class I)/GGDEF domain-containing protein
MLYAQAKERDNRFRLALRTLVPSLLFAVTLFVLFYKENEFLLFFSIMTAVSFIITYYNLYVIYSGFDKNVIDPETLVLNYKTFKEISFKALKNKKKPHTFLMIKLGDLEEINAHYGREQANLTLIKAIKILLEEIDALNFKKVPAGSFGGGIFVLCFSYTYDDVITKIKPLFEEKLACYVNDIEMEMDFALLDSEGEKSCDIVFGNLYDLIHQSNDDENSFEDHFHKEKIIEKRVKEALSSKSISLQYQEVKRLEHEQTMLEFSSKLIDNQGKLIHHSDILPVINRLGLEKKYHLIIIEAILKEIQKNNITHPFAISITAFAFRHKELIKELFELIQKYEIRPSQMMLVINESRYYKHVVRYKEIIDMYRDEGVLICLSNVGSIGPSVEYLKYMSIDCLRYDKSLAQESDNPKVLMLYEGFEKIAKDRGIKTWAIMIENQEVELRIQSIGVDFLQGRHIAGLQNLDTLSKLHKD